MLESILQSRKRNINARFRGCRIIRLHKQQILQETLGDVDQVAADDGREWYESW